MHVSTHAHMGFKVVGCAVGVDVGMDIVGCGTSREDVVMDVVGCEVGSDVVGTDVVGCELGMDVVSMAVGSDVGTDVTRDVGMHGCRARKRACRGTWAHYGVVQDVLGP